MRRGHSLAEVLVAAALFALLLASLSWVYVVTNRSSRQADPDSEAARLAMVGLEKIRAELADALVLSPTGSATELRYRVPELDAGGRPRTAGSFGLEWSEERVLRRSPGGGLERVQGGDVQRLGTLSALRFQRESNRLRVECEATVKGRTRKVAAELPLRHQR